MMNMNASVPVSYLGLFMSSSVISIKISAKKKNTQKTNENTLIVSTFIISKVTRSSGVNGGICSAPPVRLFAALALTFA